MSATKTTTASGIVLPDDLATRYRLAESQLALLPPADEDDAEEWLALRIQCEEVMAFVERIAAAEAQVALLRTNHPFGAMYDALIKSQAQVAELQAQLQRATDLVRYARHHLHDEKAITDAEYAELVEDSDSGKRVARLEGYDRTRTALQAQINALRSENQRLQAPVSDAEWAKGYPDSVGIREVGFTRSQVDALIRTRAEAPQEKKP